MPARELGRPFGGQAPQVNARVVIPVTTFDNITRGFPVDYILYANNYEAVDKDHPVIQACAAAEDALNIFREGTAMSKGTTTTTGLVHTYFVNVFGAVQYQSLHDEIAKRFFKAIFDNQIFVGQTRTQLGIKGLEQNGPIDAAKELLKMIKA